MINATVVGRLGRDPEMRYTPSGESVTSFSVASRGRKDATQWVNVTAWGKVGETLNQYLAKGQPIALTGALQMRSYRDRNEVERTVLELTVRDFEFIASRPAGNTDESDADAPLQDLPF